MNTDSGTGQKKSEEGFDRLTPAYHPHQQEKQPPCQADCPNCGDIRQWIGVVAQRGKLGLSDHQAFARAWQTITDVNPFPGVLGRICPHPCEDRCTRTGLDDPLAINAMERFLGDWAIKERLPLRQLSNEPRREWLGVVGAGPSGLSFAYQMARRAYRVTVYEAQEQAGGMLRYGVPDYRLPPAVLDAEISRILDLGVELKLNTMIGRDITLEELRKRHTTLYLGLGAQQGRNLGLPGEDGPSVWTGTDYLSRFNNGEKIDLGAAVVVTGGGNTAVDAARCARRTGAEVSLIYRRSMEEMPAIQAEVEDMLEEGIELLLLATPTRLQRSDDGRLENLVACRMALGEADSSGRRRPEPIPGSEFSMPVDTLITAVSQAPVLDGFEALDHTGNWLSTDQLGNVSPGIQAGGDMLKLGIAGNAIMQGRSAAEELHAKFQGRRSDGLPDDPRPPVEPQQVTFDQTPTSTPVRALKLPADERIDDGRAEVANTISEQQFLREAKRCFSCGSCMGCESCSMFCTSGCFTKLTETGPGMYFSLTLDMCKACGKCIEVCPCGFLDAYQPPVP